MEEFRTPLVDRLTLYLINNGIFKEEDFFIHTASGSKYLKDEARKRYFVEYEHFVTRTMSVAGEEAETCYRRIFRRQAERLRHALMERTTYEPYKFSW